MVEPWHKKGSSTFTSKKCTSTCVISWGGSLRTHSLSQPTVSFWRFENMRVFYSQNADTARCCGSPQQQRLHIHREICPQTYFLLAPSSLVARTGRLWCQGDISSNQAGDVTCSSLRHMHCQSKMWTRGRYSFVFYVCSNFWLVVEIIAFVSNPVPNERDLFLAK